LDPLRVVAYTDTVEVGGAEHALRHLVAALDDAVEVTVVGVAEHVVARIAEGRPSLVVRRPRPMLADARALREHVRALRTLAPQVVHANLISPFSCQYGIAAALGVGIPSVAVYQLPNAPANRRQRLLKKLTALRTTAHVAVGERTAREVEAIIGLRRGRVGTIHNGVPDVPLPQRRRRADGALRIGAVGRLAPQKGFDILLRALPLVPAAELVLVGGGEEHAGLHDLAKTIGVLDRVSFLGWVDEPRRLLPSFDVFVLPSRFEGFPLAVLEAQLARVPVIAADVGSVPEAVVDGQTGVLVPATDPAALATALKGLASDPERRRRLGDAGRALVLERYTAAHMARRFEQLYQQVAM
jgi:glycosyltransferase involved in cell wall biosynthesis